MGRRRFSGSRIASSTESGIDSCRLMLFAYPIAKLLMFQLCCQNPIASHVLTKNHLPITPPAYC